MSLPSLAVAEYEVRDPHRLLKSDWLVGSTAGCRDHESNDDGTTLHMIEPVSATLNHLSQPGGFTTI